MMEEKKSGLFWRITFYLIGLVILHFFKDWSFLFFHTVAEVFSFSVGLSLFLVTWNVRNRLERDFFPVLCMAFLIGGLLDFLHALTYRGMGLMPDVSADTPTQLWIAARYLQTVTIALVPGLLRRPPLKERTRRALLFGFFLTGMLLAAIIMATDFFPSCYVEGKGLTSFKIISEYIVIALLAIGIIRIWKNRKEFSPSILRFLNIFLVLSILSELSFTVYVDVFETAIAIGHLMRIAAMLMLYNAVLEIGIRRPSELMFRELADREQKLTEKTAALEKALVEKDLLMRETSHRVKNNFSSIVTLLNLKEEETASAELKQSYREIVGRIRSMALVHENLYKSRDARYVDFLEYATNVCGELVSAYRRSVSGVQILYELKPASVPVETALVLGMILSELVTNTFKHAFPAEFKGLKKVTIRFGPLADGTYSLEVHDTGIGIVHDLTAGDSGSLGHRIVPALARQIGGAVKMNGEGGTHWTIHFSGQGISIPGAPDSHLVDLGKPSRGILSPE